VPSDPTSTAFSRWDITANPPLPADGTGDFRNAHNTFGYIVEIDLYAPTSTRSSAPVRVAAPTKCLAQPGHVSRLAFFYMAAIHAVSTFASSCRKAVVVADANRADRLSVGAEYTKARSTPPSSTPMARHLGEAGSEQPGGVVLPSAQNPTGHVRKPGRHLRQHLPGGAGATCMDRPEWTAVENGEIYITMTENPDRGNTAGVSGNNVPNPDVDAANPSLLALDSKGVITERHLIAAQRNATSTGTSCASRKR
jgi:hypothetical protein